MALKKICSYRGCTKVLEDGVVYCSYHQEKWEKRQRERYKDYSKRRQADKEQKKYQDFYNSDDWKQERLAVITNCFGIDILEYYRTGKIVVGQTVHHISTLEDDWNSRLDFYNLIYLTEQNHRRVHAEYEKGQREKKQMQDILFSLLDRWNDEFDC